MRGAALRWSWRRALSLFTLLLVVVTYSRSADMIFQWTLPRATLSTPSLAQEDLPAPTAARLKPWLPASMSHPTASLPTWSNMNLLDAPPFRTTLESELVIGVLTSAPTFHRLVAVHNTWRKHTRATVLYYTGDMVSGAPLRTANETAPVECRDDEAAYRDILDMDVCGPTDPSRYYHGSPFSGAVAGRIPPESVVVLPTPELHSHKVTAKSFLAWESMWERHGSDKKWFMKADDDTYIIPGNLLAALDTLDPSRPLFVGHDIANGLMSGGAGYLMSHGLLSRVAPLLRRCLNEDIKGEGAGEDVEMLYCIKKHVPDVEYINVPPLTLYLPSGASRWAGWDANWGPFHSDPASLHYATPVNMYMLDYLFYEQHDPLRQGGERSR